MRVDRHTCVPSFSGYRQCVTLIHSNRIGYILNISREIDNFYPEVFKYYNVRLYDIPQSELMKYWENTYRFIKEAK